MHYAAWKVPLIHEPGFRQVVMAQALWVTVPGDRETLGCRVTRLQWEAVSTED